MCFSGFDYIIAVQIRALVCELISPGSLIIVTDSEDLSLLLECHVLSQETSIVTAAPLLLMAVAFIYNQRNLQVAMLRL